MFVACHGNKQPKMGVGVKAEAVDDVRATRSLVSSVGSDHEPLFMTGVARAPVAIATERREEKKRMLIIETSG